MCEDKATALAQKGAELVQLQEELAAAMTESEALRRDIDQLRGDLELKRESLAASSREKVGRARVLARKGRPVSARAPRSKLCVCMHTQDEALQLVGEMRDQFEKTRVELDRLCAENKRLQLAQPTFHDAVRASLDVCCHTRVGLTRGVLLLCCAPVRCPTQVEKEGGGQLLAAQDRVL